MLMTLAFSCKHRLTQPQEEMHIELIQDISSHDIFFLTGPEVVTNLTVAKFTTSSISLMWTEPEGNRSFYRVQWTNGTANWDKNVTDTNITVTGLTAGVQYRFTVIAVAGENTTQSEMAQISHYTSKMMSYIYTDDSACSYFQPDPSFSI